MKKTAKIIDGKLVSKEILENLTKEITKLEKKPCLAVIIVGEDPASKIYVNNKRKKALETGIESIVIEMAENASKKELLTKIEKLNNDDNVNAILVQLPLPKHIDTSAVIETINPIKDVDCFHPCNVGRISTGNKPYIYPCTPQGIIKLFKYYNIALEGKNAVVIGRSNIVGKPVAQMLTNENATVTICHSKTRNLADLTKNADIIVSAIGVANFIKEDMIKDGAVIIDVGMNRIFDGEKPRLTGDVDKEGVEEKAAYLTPVPGGVGPMTICCLMQNTLDLYKLQNRIE